MSKVSISGTKSVMEAVIEVLHTLELIHLEEYDEGWDGFRTGDPLERAEDVSEQLVTVRALENTLDLDADDIGKEPLRNETDVEARLEEVRTTVNELEDEESAVAEELRSVRDDLDRLKPLAKLGIDLDLLQGYSSIETAVGTGPREAIDSALAESDAVDAYELFHDGSVVAVAARPSTPGEPGISDALVGVEFSHLEIPAGTGDPNERRDELERRRQQLENDLDRIETELEAIKLEHGGFLLALEERLTIEVQRAEAPLRFATTDHSFIAEGWVPTRQVSTLDQAITDAVGDRADVDELEQMDYDPPHEHHEAETDGGERDMHGEHPPVVQRNPSIVKPFEVFVQTVNRPRYHEIDPTIFVFLTFPLAFGYMIGDIGYGLLYVAMGWLVLKYTDNEGLRALGMIAIWAGVFTMLFGYLYDDTFGVHMADLGISLPLAGSLSKGLQTVEVAQLWILLSILFGVIHLGVGYFLGFVNDLNHGVYNAFTEKGAWLLVLGGLFVWIFSVQEAGAAGWKPAPIADVDLTASGIKPEFLVGTEGVLYANPLFDLGFGGFSETVAIAALVVFLVGWVFAYLGEGFIAIIEMPTNAFGHAVSYIRMMAVLLAKGGMAFAVNLLVFGGYTTPGGYTVFNLPTTDVSGYEQQFVGLVHADPFIIAIPLAIFVFVIGHVIVLLLGITAAGIQMTRLEYVEFFGKFYDGGGGKFEPFGYKSATEENY